MSDKPEAMNEKAMRVLQYVSRGRGYVDVEPYPDSLAREALGELRLPAQQAVPEAVLECAREVKNMPEEYGDCAQHLADFVLAAAPKEKP